MSQTVETEKLLYFDRLQLLRSFYQQVRHGEVSLQDFATSHNLSISDEERRRFDLVASNLFRELSRYPFGLIDHCDVMTLFPRDFRPDYKIPNAVYNNFSGSGEAVEALIGVGAIIRDFLRSEGFVSLVIVSFYDTVEVERTFYLQVKF